MAKEKVALIVEGMSCIHCENRIKKALGKLDGVSNVSVDLKSKEVLVEHDPEITDISVIRYAIIDQGYDVN